MNRKKEEKVFTSDDMKEFIRLIGPLVKFHIKCIKLGFDMMKIAVTLVQVYAKELKLQLDDEAIEIVNKEVISERRNGVLTPINRAAVVASICMKMSAALVQACCKTLQEDRD